MESTLEHTKILKLKKNRKLLKFLNYSLFINSNICLKFSKIQLI